MSKKSLSVIVPVFNEERRLPKLFAALEEFFGKSIFSPLEIIFVNDGSRDNTLLLLRNFEKKYPEAVKVISYPENRGKGFAVRSGMLSAKNDWLLSYDVDLSVPLEEMAKFLPHMDKNCPVIIGSREMKNSLVVKHQPWVREKLGQCYTKIANIVTRLHVSDFTCGFKCFSTDAAAIIFPRAKINRWSYDAEILYIAHKAKLQICEVGVSWKNNEDTRVRLWKDAPRSLFDLLRILFIHPVTRKPRAEARGGMVGKHEASPEMPRPEGRGNGVHGVRRQR